MAITTPHQPSLAMNFSIHGNNSPTLNAIEAKGEIRLNDVNKLHAFVSLLPQKKHTAIYFTSPGGNLFGGIKLGLYFRQHRIKTVIQADEMCASACAIAFLGGTDYKGRRWMSTTNTSRLDFHSFQTGDGQQPQDPNKTQKIVAAILQYGMTVGAPMEIFVRNFQTPSNQVYWFTSNEALRLGIKVWHVRNNCFVGVGKC